MRLTSCGSCAATVSWKATYGRWPLKRRVLAQLLPTHRPPTDQEYNEASRQVLTLLLEFPAAHDNGMS